MPFYKMLEVILKAVKATTLKNFRRTARNKKI